MADEEAEIVGDEDIESGPSKARNAPQKPTLQEVERHEASGHCPYRSWCRACVAGRGRDDKHLRDDPGGVATLAFDYGYLEPRAEACSVDESPSPILIARCSVTGLTFAELLPCKGTGHPWCVQSLVNMALVLGQDKLILKSDAEAAIVDLKTRAAAVLRATHQMTIIPEESPVGEKAANGLAEGAVRDVKAQ
eukprot:2239647-Amphidinium_carterae.1